MIPIDVETILAVWALGVETGLGNGNYNRQVDKCIDEAYDLWVALGLDRVNS